jgi:hypothetical protein
MIKTLFFLLYTKQQQQQAANQVFSAYISLINDNNFVLFSFFLFQHKLTKADAPFSSEKYLYTFFVCVFLPLILCVNGTVM